MNAQSYKANRKATADECREIGDFVWSEERDCLYIVLPNATGKPALDSKGEAALDAIRVSRGAACGPRVWGWDGNEDAPTLQPSLHWLNNWHGFLQQGVLKSC